MNTQFSLLGRSINLAPRARRRWIVVSVDTALAAVIIGWWANPRILGIVALLALLLSFLAMTAVAGSGAEEGDERQVHRRDHVFFIAHHYLGWMLMLVVIITSIRGSMASALVGPVFGAVLEQVAGVVLFTYLALYGTLPQAILLWTEPDLEEVDER